MNTLGLDQFWHWLQQHTHCILRVGTADAALFDHDEFHWAFSEIEPDTWLVQLVRGKRAVGELVLSVAGVSHVNMTEGEDDDWLFELVSPSEDEHSIAGHFTFTHGYASDVESPDDSWIN